MQSPQDVYKYIELTSEIMTASSHRRIQMLFEKCLFHMRQASNHIMARNIPKKCESIAKALDIVSYLRVCLNIEDKSAKELSARLESIYLYIESKLLQANLRNDMEALTESVKLLDTVKTGWDAISEEVKTETP